MTPAEKAQVDQHGQAIVQILSVASWLQGVAKLLNDVLARITTSESLPRISYCVHTSLINPDRRDRLITPSQPTGFIVNAIAQSEVLAQR